MANTQECSLCAKSLRGMKMPPPLVDTGGILAYSSGERPRLSSHLVRVAQLARGWHRGWGLEPREAGWALESTHFTAALHCLASETKGPVHVMTAGIWKCLDTNPALTNPKAGQPRESLAGSVSNWNPDYRPARIPPCGRWSQLQDEGIETFCCIKGCLSPSQPGAPASPNHNSGSRTNAQGLPH